MAGVYLYEAQNAIPPPPLHIVYSILIQYSHREGGDGRESNREKVRGATVYKAGSKVLT